MNDPPIAMYDHAALYRRDRPAIDAAVARVLASGRYDWGPEVPAFEAEFAAALGAAHAVGTSSGTAALKVALLACGIGPGDEVITPPNSDIASTAAIRHVGATPVWADVSPDTHNLDPGAVAAAIGPRTRAIMAVDLYGHPADLPALGALARRHGLALIEDGCLALGASLDGRPVGRWADLTCFSFQPSKHLAGFGTGGAVVTDDPERAARMRRLVAYGENRRPAGANVTAPREHLDEGLNERLDELRAALLRARLPGLGADLARRRANAAAWTAALAGSAVAAPVERPGASHAFRNYVVEVADRDAVRARLAARGVESGLHYAPPLHLQPVYRALGRGPGSFPVTEAAARRLVSLPVGPHLSPADCAEGARRLLACL
jgi:dTDP-3-amino-3,4,6-trideoxy-alpha-D-glucose transaminase